MYIKIKKISCIILVIILIVSCNQKPKYSKDEIVNIVRVKKVIEKLDNFGDPTGEFYYSDLPLTENEKKGVLNLFKKDNISYFIDTSGNIYFLASSICKFNCEFAWLNDAENYQNIDNDTIN